MSVLQRIKQFYKRAIRRVKTRGIPIVKPTVIRRFGHDSTSFTQGLTWSDGKLYESTGLKKKSSLREISIETGEVKLLINEKKYWCEGIAIFRGMLFQLTYKNGVALIYTLPELKKVRELNYEGEGWGLTANSQSLIMSNGSNLLYFRNEDFQVVKVLEVFLKGKALKGINDIQCVKNKIYANIFYDTDIFEIELGSGLVSRIIDCSDIVIQSKRKSYHEVLNGIAYCELTHTFFLTGKHWPYLFEVKFN